MEPIDITVTCPDEETARSIARAVVDRRLAACAQISGPIRSIYRWEDEIAEDEEWLLTMKSRAGRFDEIEAAVRALHPYDLPAIVGIPARASGDVAGWIADETR